MFRQSQHVENLEDLKKCSNLAKQYLKKEVNNAVEKSDNSISKTEFWKEALKELSRFEKRKKTLNPAKSSKNKMAVKAGLKDNAIVKRDGYGHKMECQNTFAIFPFLGK